MTGFLGGAYLWVKAFHIIFVIFWMAGLFLMPRYLAYHTQYGVGSDEDGKWIHREDRLAKIILNPAFIVSWVLGLMLAAHNGADIGVWFHIKFLILIFLSVFHMMLAGWRKKMAAGERVKTEKFFRMVNEVPALAIILIVILAVVRPL